MLAKSKILSQGIMDGFCLQYAILNTYKALKNPGQSALQYSIAMQPKWRKIISLSPSLENFASGQGSVFGVDTHMADIRVTEGTIYNYIHAINERSNPKIEIKRVSIKEAIKNDFENSLLIFCLRQTARTKHYSGMDHWVSCINITSDHMKLACSYSAYFFDDSFDNFEIQDKIGRYYNNEMPKSYFISKHIYENSIYSVMIRP